MIGFLQILGDLVFRLEISRQKLVNDCKDFNTIDAFRILDTQGKGYLDFSEL